MKIFICIAVLLLNCSSSFAHSCATFDNYTDQEYKKKLNQADGIFEGEVLSVTDLGYQSYLIKLKALRVWKGYKAKEITVKYGNPCSSQAPSVGGKRIIYGYKQDNDPFLFVSCCQPFNDARMKLEYGEGEAITHPENASQTSADVTPADGFGTWLWKKIRSFFS
jgi:hypothetical protein